MAVIHLKHTNINVAFLINAIFSAILFGTLFVIDDTITQHLNKSNVRGNKRHTYRFILHFIAITFITFILVYLFKYIFGWGSIFIGKEI